MRFAPDEAADARKAIDRVYACVAKAGSLGEPGDTVFFNRRIWHARSRNYSEHTRKAVFFGYTYRWTAIRD